MSLTLNVEQMDTFRKDGVVCLRNVFSPDWVGLVERGIVRNLAEPGPFANYADGDKKQFFQDANNWQRIPEFEEFARHSPARLLAAQLLRSSKINFLHDHTLVKRGGTSKATQWHQDQPYSPVDGWQFCTIWMPVDPVPRDAVLEFVAGSHSDNRWYRPQRFIDGSLREGDDPSWELLPDIEADRAAHNIVAWAVMPGDALVFHGLTLHGAPGNPYDTARRVLTTRWTGDDARMNIRKGKLSPPLPEVGAPAHGAVLDCDAFPVVWGGVKA
ncbi:phytanoyl-CoA dioxygenase family protein [Caballeronia sp. DA-9]|uniref:phytanoyl-CoA dioxygenase family protein n=1 Tax=Caballeronia sp. DA-9 TaxID=3436237 RepID=UPI003F662AD7